MTFNSDKYQIWGPNQEQPELSLTSTQITVQLELLPPQTVVQCQIDFQWPWHKQGLKDGEN